MKLFKIIVAVVIMYLYIYSPALQLLPLGLDKIVFICSVLYILIDKSCYEYLKLFKKDYKYLFVIFLFSLVNFILHFGEYGSGLLMYDFFLLIEPIPVACVLYKFFSSKLEIDIKEVIFITSGIAGLITVYLLLNPQMAAHVKTNVLRVPEITTTYFSFRGIGFADGLMNPYPTAQGLVLGLLLCGFFSPKIYYYVLAIPIFVSIIVNARTGVAPIPIGLLLFVLFCARSVNKKNLIIGAAVVVTIVFVVYNNFGITSEAEESLEFGKSTWDILYGIVKGEEVENMEALTETMVFYPDSIIGWLFGNGYSVYGGGGNLGKSSDIGYIIRLNYGGIVYLFLLIATVFNMCRRLYKINKPMGLLLLGSFAIFNYKTDFFIMSPCSRLFFLIYVIIVCMSFDNSRARVDCPQTI